MEERVSAFLPMASHPKGTRVHFIAMSQTMPSHCLAEGIQALTGFKNGCRLKNACISNLKTISGSDIRKKSGMCRTENFDSEPLNLFLMETDTIA